MSTERIIVDERSPTSSSRSSPTRPRRCRSAIRARAMSCWARWSTQTPVERVRRADRRRRWQRARPWSAGGDVNGTRHDGDRPRPRDAGHAHLFGGVLRSGGVGDPRARTSTTRCGSPTTPNTACPRRCSAGHRRGRSHVAKRIEVRHLPHQRPDRARRGADAVRRHQGLRLRPLRRQGGDRTVHRLALDHDRRWAAAIRFDPVSAVARYPSHQIGRRRSAPPRSCPPTVSNDACGMRRERKN